MTFGPHLGETAELYALGTLEADERAQVDAHVATCARCARALGDAEGTVAALDDEFVEQVDPPARLAMRISASARAVTPRRVPRRFAATNAGLAVAASLLLTLGIGGGVLIERAADVRQDARESAILATLANAHFFHQTLTRHDPKAPVSKVIYARDGAWSYVVIASDACNCHVAARSAAGQVDVGVPDVRGTTSTLFTSEVTHPTAISLIDPSGHVLAEAQLSYTP